MPGHRRVIGFCNEWEAKRETLPYEIDGMVIKVDDLRLQGRLGSTGKSPRWAISYKFPAKQATTTVKKIIASVGRTGAVTPVAISGAGQVGGVTISRAALYNADELVRLNINVGDLVLVERGGEVIPKVVKVVEKKTPGVYKLAGKLPLVRERSGARGGRGGDPLHKHKLPGTAAEKRGALRLARRDGH